MPEISLFKARLSPIFRVPILVFSLSFGESRLGFGEALGEDLGAFYGLQHRLPSKESYWGSFHRRRFGEVCPRLDGGVLGEDEASPQDHRYGTQGGFYEFIVFIFNLFFGFV